MCNACSSQSVRYFPNTTIINGPNQLCTTSVTHKTCDVCVDEINMIRGALEVSSVSLPSTTKYLTSQRTFLKSGTNSIRDEASDNDLCPVCGKNLWGMYPGGESLEEFKETHISECLVSNDFAHEVRTKNKMLVFNMGPIPDPKLENIGSLGSSVEEEWDECVICLEELKAGDKVGRLECLCVFHYGCIKSWFNKGRGECPVHSLTHA